MSAGESQPLRRLPGRARLAAAGVAALLLAALAGPWLAPYGPNDLDLERRLEGPSVAHPLGLDELGRDVLSRLLAGARVSVTVGLSVVGLAGSVGTLLGVFAGALGGRADAALRRAIDVFLAFPGILLAIALVAVLGPALRHVLLALVTIGWVGYARLARGQTLALAGQEFVLAARAAGVSTARLVFRHLLPNCLPPLIVVATVQVAAAIALEATLSFLGLGLPITEPSLGLLIANGYQYLLSGKYWISFFPGIALLCTIVSINLVADQLRDVLNPRLSR